MDNFYRMLCVVCACSAVPRVRNPVVFFFFLFLSSLPPEVSYTRTGRPYRRYSLSIVQILYRRRKSPRKPGFLFKYTVGKSIEFHSNAARSLVYIRLMDRIIFILLFFFFRHFLCARLAHLTLYIVKCEIVSTFAQTMQFTSSSASCYLPHGEKNKNKNMILKRYAIIIIMIYWL